MARLLRLKKNQAQILRWVGYPLFAVGVFVTSFYLSLPLDRIRERLQRELSQESGPPAPGSGAWGIGTGMDVTIGDIGLHLLPIGAGASDITLRARQTAGGGAGDSEAGKRSKAMFIESLRVRLPVLTLLAGEQAIGLDVQALGGSVTGDGGVSDEGASVHGELEHLTLSRAPILGQYLPLPVLGTLSGHVDVKVPARKQEKGAPARKPVGAGFPPVPLDYNKATGLIEIRVENGVLGDGKAKLAVPGDPFLSQGLTFPKLSLGNVTGRVVFDRGRATLSDVRSQSSDAEISLEGYVELRDPIQLSELRLYLRFRPSPALIKREPTMEILTNAMAVGKRSDGSLGFSLTGTVAAPRSRPSKDPPDGVSIRAGSLGAVGKDASPPLRPGAPPSAAPPPPPPATTVSPQPLAAPPSFALPSAAPPAPPPPPVTPTAAPPPIPPSQLPPPAPSEAAGHHGVAGAAMGEGQSEKPASDRPAPTEKGDSQPDPPPNYPTNQRGF